MELKTPTTPLNDPTFFADAVEKAQHWKAPYFALWNMREAELYPTPAVGGLVTPADRISQWPTEPLVRRVEDWIDPTAQIALKARGIEILETAWRHEATGNDTGQVIDAEIFVARLADAMTRLRAILYRELTREAHSSGNLRRTLRRIASEQGFIGFVEDIGFAIAGQIGYRLIGQILFYFALRRKQPSLPPLHLDPSASLAVSLRPFWDEVRRYDYEALFKPDPIDSLISVPQSGDLLVRHLVEQMEAYDWASLTDDILGSVFEKLIPPEEQMLLGQFYTPRHVADFLVAITLDGSRPLVLDPGCGSGTFLMSSYDCLSARTELGHKDLLSIIWGFDLSPFAAELAAINLFRQDLTEFDNFPRIVPGNFFDRDAGQSVEFPPPRPAASGLPTKVPVPIPQFDCIVGNPPYLRSQNQDDLDPGYRRRLFDVAARVGIKAGAKTDLFAFFIYHSLRMLRIGGRIGFVTPASWLTSDYAAALQRLLLGELHLIAVVASSAEAFFPQVHVNAVLLVAERRESLAPREPLRFVNLKERIATLVGEGARYWQNLTDLIDFIQEQTTSFEDESIRVKLVPEAGERQALASQPDVPRNWSKYVRAPLSYYKLFGEPL